MDYETDFEVIRILTFRSKLAIYSIYGVDLLSMTAKVFPGLANLGFAWLNWTEVHSTVHFL